MGIKETIGARCVLGMLCVCVCGGVTVLSHVFEVFNNEKLKKK